ncbi:hypothetical protein Taro_004056 [Colocasia esculenta]|uniref:Uncharacterized protein n=1 Tax=Colocasia esculenta TaxID=4460 RepID=A0A843TH64_COLES|nr:hypothetical protein [Colocasia esculenta]
MPAVGRWSTLDLFRCIHPFSYREMILLEHCFCEQTKVRKRTYPPDSHLEAVALAGHAEKAVKGTYAGENVYP